MINHASQRELLEVVGALHSPCGFAGGLNGRQKKGDQNTDDRDDDEKFNKSKTTWFAPPPPS